MTRGDLRKAVAEAKDRWIISSCHGLYGDAGTPGGTSKMWSTVDRRRAGLTKTRPSRQVQMKRPDGSRCSSPRENAGVFQAHFEKLYAWQPQYDPGVLEDIDRRQTRWEIGDVPTDDQIRMAVRRPNHSAPGASGVRAELWKLIADDDQLYKRLRQVIHGFWNSGKQPSELDIGRLGILPKKGDLSLPGNYRGIMMLEVAQKIVSNIVVFRLQSICEELDHESQCGFRPDRGTACATSSLKLALKKHREHGLETWVVFVDFVRASDRVLRELLWQTVERYDKIDRNLSLCVL